ncbi:MAG TPA: hypothetical protein DC058_16220 [Planctomycetaceae bacterium]|nr:hypothetical protein [Planctomycetaceae bacterium]
MLKRCFFATAESNILSVKCCGNGTTSDTSGDTFEFSGIGWLADKAASDCFPIFFRSGQDGGSNG